MTVNLERLNLLDTITLKSGSHSTAEDGMCAEEFVAYLAGEPHSDSPTCVSPVLRGFTINLNDQWTTDQRQKLKPYLPAQIGTAGDGQDEDRSYLALDWLIRSFTPAWLDLAGLTAEATALRDLRRIVDLVSATAAGPVVKEAQTKARAAGDAAWAAARAAAGDAAGAAAGDAAWAAARAAARAAAWDAARAAARDAARAAARDAAGDAAGAAARDAAGDAAGDAAWAAARAAAWDAAWDAAGAAARDAAGAALQPTVDTLQASALDLLGRMTNPKGGAGMNTTVKPRMTATTWEVRAAGDTYGYLGMITRDYYTHELTAYPRSGHIKVPPLDSGESDFATALSIITTAAEQVSA